MINQSFSSDDRMLQREHWKHSYRGVGKLSVAQYANLWLLLVVFIFRTTVFKAEFFNTWGREATEEVLIEVSDFCERRGPARPKFSATSELEALKMGQGLLEAK